MSSSFSKPCRWLLRKLVLVVLIALVGFATCGFWLFDRNAENYENDPGVHVAYHEHCERELARLEEEIAGLDVIICEREQREATAARVVKALGKLENAWDRLIWNNAQQRANDEQLARMKTIARETRSELVHLRRERVLKEYDREDASQELARVERTLRDLDEGISLKGHYAKEAWHQGRGYVALVLTAYLLGPSSACLGLYFCLAPIITRGRPLRLAGAPVAFTTVSAPTEVVESALWPGSVFRGKKKFFAAADDDLVRKSRLLMSWRIPFSSLACGFFNLLEVRNVRNDGGRKITLACLRMQGGKFKVVDVPEGGSLVLRPGFLAGLIFKSAEPLVIRRHWRFFHWQSWSAGQFRFFEFVGPCRLILAGDDTLRAERLVDGTEVAAPVFRVKQSKVAAFTPSLECRPVRAISFWRYYTGAARLFEAGFSGPGVVVYATPHAQGGIKSSSWCRRVLKVFGL